MNISMHNSNNAGLNPMGFGIQQRYLGMSTGVVNVNPTTNKNSLMGVRTSNEMKINSTNNTHTSQIASSQIASRQIASRQIASRQIASRQTTFVATSDKDKPPDLVANAIPIDEFLDSHTLTIKYKKGDEIVQRLKKNLKADKLHKKVKFRSDKKLKWSPQYHLDGEVTDLRGYMNNELLYINLIEQLEDWRESSESSGFDDKTDSEAEDSEAEVANEEVEVMNNSDDEEVANDDVENNSDDEEVANEDEEVANDDEEVANEDEDHSDDE